MEGLLEQFGCDLDFDIESQRLSLRVTLQIVRSFETCRSSLAIDYVLSYTSLFP